MAKRKDPDILSETEEAAAQEYVLNGGDQAKAWRKAHPRSRAKDKTVWEEASRLFSQPKVRARIAELRKQASERAVVSESMVLEETSKIAFADLRRVFDSTGALLPVHQWPDDVAGAISSIEVVEMAGGAEIGGEAGIEHQPMYTKKVRLWDKNTALEKLFRHLGLYEQDNTQKNPVVANLDKLPLEIQQLIVNKLHAIASSRSELDGGADPGSSQPVTH